MWTYTIVALALPLAAHAEHGAQAGLQIENRFDGEAEVYVDGRFVGLVPGDGTARFDTKPGVRDVTVKRPGTGYVLSTVRLKTSKDALVIVPVDAPWSTLRVDNAGEVPLELRVAERTAWVAPGTAVQIPVLAGQVELIASIRDPRGTWTAQEHTVWVEPGLPSSTVMKPDPSVVIVVNGDRIPVRVQIGGLDLGWVAAGATQRLWVRPGATAVLLTDATGRVRSMTHVDVRRGGESRVVLEPLVPVSVSHHPHVVSMPSSHTGFTPVRVPPPLSWR